MPQKPSYRAAVNWFVLLGQHNQGCSASPVFQHSLMPFFLSFLLNPIPWAALPPPPVLQRTAFCTSTVVLHSPLTSQCQCDLCYRDIKAQHPLGKGEIKGEEMFQKHRQAGVVFSPFWNNNLPEGVLSTPAGRSGSSRGSVHSLI